MKPTLQGIVAVIGLSVTLAHAAPEQWLQYRTAREPQGYRWLDLTNAPPPGVAWPQLGPHAQYGQWNTTLDPKGTRWICVDRTTKSGPCDRLFVDTNGNGRFDDEAPLKAARREEYMAYFDSARLTFKGEDGPLTYHLNCRFYQYGTNRAQLLISSGCTYEGKVTLGGKKRLLQLIDNTVNGSFNDISANPYESDRVLVDEKEGFGRYLGRYLEVDNQLLEIEIAPDGAFIKAKPALNVATGTVRVPETISEFTAVGTNGHFVRKPSQGELALPVGSYRVYGWTIDRKDRGGVQWRLNGSGFTDFARFDVSAAQPVVLRVGEPISTILQASQNKAELSFALRMQGNLGESVQIMRGSEQGPPPKLQLASAAGAFRTTNNFQYG